jgi:2-polyprenyl-3-methyl-5-hydroxy-6-metoxy-1,4-benzoquinol methylase
MAKAAEDYARMVASYEAQRRRRSGGIADTDWWSTAAARFREDPRRPLDANLEALAEYIQSDDVLLDVGGGAGRLSLPLAPRCREIINIEPAAGMVAAFEASAKEAGITNARSITADWLSAPEVEGDVSLAAHVTYFVSDIEAFIHKLHACSRRRVLIVVSSTPPPNQSADLNSILHGEPYAPVPGYRELLPVLWDLGCLPDVRVLSRAGPGALRPGMDASFPTREGAIESILRDASLDPAGLDKARTRIDASFERLFVFEDESFKRRSSDAPRLMIITWETAADS